MQSRWGAALAASLPVATLVAASAFGIVRDEPRAMRGAVRGGVGLGAGEAASCPNPDDPETACSMPPSRADEFLGLENGPSVYGRPAYTFEEDAWLPCAPAAQGVAAWDGCDPFSDPSSSFHYAKPYGTPEDAAALVLWEPGRGERGWFAYQESRHYYQSDQWDGPVSWNDGYYGGDRDGHMCGGMYAENFRVAGQTVSEDGYGGQGCS